MSSFPSALNRLNRPHNLTLILRDVGKSPLKNIPYEIRDLNDRVVKSGTTDGQGQIKLVYQAGVRLNLYLQPLKQGKMQKYKEFTTQAQDGSVVWTTSLLLAEAELKPEGDAGEYWRGTYEVKKGDTLTSIAKHYGTQVSTLLALNPSIKDKDEIAVGIVLRVPPNKQSNDRNSERRNPPKPSNQQTDQNTYQVKRGDTLTGIAKDYDTSIDAIMKVNPNIKNKNTIAEGLTLHLPTQNEGQQNRPQTQLPAQPEKIQQTPSTAVKTGQSNVGLRTTPPRGEYSVSQNPNGSSNSTRSLPSNTSQSSGTQKTSTSTQPIRQTESTNKEGNAITTLSPECVCKQSQLIWGAKVDCKFRKKVIEIAAQLWGESAKFDKANMLMAVFAWESGGTFAADVPNMKDSGGTGLIQMMPSTYESLFKRKPTLVKTKKYYNKSLTVIKELADMTALQYLDVVKKYFMPLKGKNIDFVDLYLQVLFPASSGKSEHTVFARSKDLLDVTDHADERVEKFARNNMDGFYLDANGNLHKDGKKDGKVMKSEIAAAVEHYRADGANYRSDYRDHDGGGSVATAGATTPVNYQQAAQEGQAQKSECKDGCSVKSTEQNAHQCITGRVEGGFIIDERVKIYKVPAYNKFPIDQVKAIVLHRTAGGPNVKNYLDTRLKSNSSIGVQFWIGRDGVIYQAGGLDKLSYHIDRAPLSKPKIANLWSKYAIGIEVSGYYLNPNGEKAIGNVIADPKGSWEAVSDDQAKAVACLLHYLLHHYNFTLDNVTVHEQQCHKMHDEGQTVYDAMLPYFNQHE